MTEGCDNEVTSPSRPASPEPGGNEVTPQRRRGAALEEAILDAAYAELTESGYLAFSVEGVAARARTGKGSIYRRWATKQELVLDAMLAKLPTPADCGIAPVLDDSVTTEQALLAVGRAIVETLASPAGDAMRAVKCEAMSDPQLAQLVDDRFQAPRRAAMLHLLRRGVERGEVRPGAVCPLVADVLPAVLTHRVILQRERVSPADVFDVIENVIIPLVAAR